MNSLYKIYHPGVFQGSMKKKNYFEGWYFKYVTADLQNAVAVIPGISLSEDPHSFVQFIDGNTGQTSYFRSGTDEFHAGERKLELHVGSSFFSDHGMDIELNNNDLYIAGRIIHSGITRPARRILRPGIMGWYSFVPAMECNHGVVSADHGLNGSLRINDRLIDFTGGKGYIEKDWGTSFPESWLWVQCNNFIKDKVSVMISVGKIPWRGSFFMGFIALIIIDDRTYILATYNRAKVEKLKRLDNDGTEIHITKGSYRLSAHIAKKGTGTLKAPSKGLMENITKESISSQIDLEFRRSNRLIFSGTGSRAGYEETEKIFSYFK